MVDKKPVFVDPELVESLYSLQTPDAMDKLDSYRRYNKRDDLFPNRSGGALDIDELIRIINRDSEIVLWKEFSPNMPLSMEYNINF